MLQTVSGKQIKKILIVEDEADMCLLLNIMLKKDVLEIEHVRTLAAAKQFLKNETPSLIVLDNKLPDGLGLDFINFLRGEYPGIKILMISGYRAATVRDVALFSGADGFLEKPFTKEQVFSSVEALLN